MSSRSKVSQRKGFARGDLVWLSEIQGLRDNVYKVEAVEHRNTLSSYPDSSLLKLRLVFKVFYCWHHEDMFYTYDEMNCSLLDENHIEEMKNRFGKIIQDIYALHAQNKKETKRASTDCPSRPTRKRKTMEPESNGPTKKGGRSKKAM